MSELTTAARVHSIKCWPAVFEELKAGRKTAEYRLDDRDYQVGDCLLIREWCPSARDYTHRELTREITHVLDAGFGMPAGYAMLSLADPRITRLEADRVELIERLQRALRYLDGSNPLRASGGIRNCDLRDEIEETLTRIKEN